MATLSPETQAIVDRLKAEGDLIRNSGTNSIKSVKIQLDRFEGVFNSIANNVAEQTDIMRMQLGMAAEAQEKLRTQEQYDEIRPNSNTQPRDENDTNEKIDKMGDKIAEALTFKNTLGTLKNLAIAGAGLFVGYNLLKGFIDEKTGGGFSSMEETIANIDWAAMKQNTTDFVDGIGKIDWNSLAEAVNKVSESILGFSEWMDDLLPGLLVGGILGAMTRGAVRGGIDSILGRRGTVGASDRRLINLSQATKIRAGIAGLVVTGMLAYSDDLKGWIDNQEWSNNEIGNMSLGDLAGGTVDVAGMALTGATFGSFFGPGGTLIGAAIGGSIGLGVKLYDWYNAKKAENDAQLQRDIAEAERLLAENRQKYEQLSQDLSTMTPAQQSEVTAGMSNAEIIALNNTITPLQAAIEELTYQQQQLENARLTGYVNPMFEANVARARAEVERLSQDVDVEQLRRAHNELGFRLDAMDGGEPGSLLPGVSAQDYKTTLEMFKTIGGILTDIGAQGTITVGGYRTGTRGFQDFGQGTFSILHGREAVVPFNTAAGQFLDQYFTDNWELRAQKANRINSAGVGASGAPVIINAPTMAPVNVSNVNGGSNASIVNVSGGGGSSGFGSPLPYGLTGAFS